jgi:hypothetical protein
MPHGRHIDPGVLFTKKISKMELFWAARNATKNGTVLGRPGVSFIAPKFITKGAKISRKLAKKMA